ncbi:MAG: hypothetical protein DRI32_05600 [Chloroflexi bacterium]|nr:MAG: hypothetical protein DRI32_05600 [Chloroflexota bacterium]
MDDKKKTLFLGLAETLWLLAVMLGYAYTHKPFSPQQIFLLLKAFWQIAAAVLILSLGGSIGTKLFPKREGISPLALLTLQAALGLGILGLVILLMGYTIGFSTLYFALFLLIFGILFRVEILHWWRLWGAFKDILAKSQKFDKLLAVGIGIILAMTLITALAPPLKFDALVYHLTLPKIYLLEGGINYTPDLIFWGMPQEIEMLNTFAMALAGAESAAVLGWGLGVLTLIGLLGFLAEHFSPRTAWVALAALLSGGTLSTSLSWAYVEWATMLYGLGIFIFLDLWSLRREKKFLWMAGILAGFALGTKYTAGILLVSALPIIFLANRGRGVKSTLRDIFTFGGIALLAFSPWLLKNLLATGNPVYPLLFPSGEMNIYRLSLHQEHPAWGNWRDFFLLPWRATVWGVEGKIGYSADIGALLLGLSAFSWIEWKERDEDQKRILQITSAILLTGFLIWAGVGRVSLLLLQSRLYFFILPIWAILAGVGFENFSKLQSAGIRFGRIAAAVILLSFGFNLFSTGANFAGSNVMKVLFGVQTPLLYREQILGKYESAMSSILALPSDSRVIMLWETRGFSCSPKCEPDEVIDRWYTDLLIYGDYQSVLNAWREKGYTHLLLNKEGADFVRNNPLEHTPINWDALDALLLNVAPLENIDGAYQLYDLMP